MTQIEQVIGLVMPLIFASFTILYATQIPIAIFRRILGLIVGGTRR